MIALAYLRSNLSRSLESTAISERNGAMSSLFHRDLVKKRSAKRRVGSMGNSYEGKYFSALMTSSLRVEELR